MSSCLNEEARIWMSDPRGGSGAETGSPTRGRALTWAWGARHPGGKSLPDARIDEVAELRMLAEEGGDVRAARDDAPVSLTRLGQGGGHELGGQATTAQFLGNPGMIEHVAWSLAGVAQPGEEAADEHFEPPGGDVVMDDEGGGIGGHGDELRSLGIEAAGAGNDVGDARMNGAGRPAGQRTLEKCIGNTSLA